MVKEKVKDSQKEETLDESQVITDAEGANIMQKIMNALKTDDVQLVENKEAEYIEKIARLQAEFDNYRKRTEKEKIEHAMNANSILISQLLDVLDHFELSLKHSKDQGIMLVYEELSNILKKQGLEVIDTKGTFNPKIHEAVLKAEGKEEGVILEEIQKGYLLNHKLLRASKVKVSIVTEKK